MVQGADEDEGLEAFLRRFRIDGGKNPTHTRFGDSFGSYYIPCTENERFYEVYARHVFRALHGGAPSPSPSPSPSPTPSLPGLVERHREVGPVVIDLDFRHKPPDMAVTGSGPPRRLVSPEAVEAFVRKYLLVADKWIRLPKEFTVYVMKKPHPRVDKGVLKDGVHIVIPEVVTDARVQLLIRRDCVEACKRVQMFDDCRLTNTMEDVFDESVIKRNGWMMYGSAKAGDRHYEVTEALRSALSFGDLVLERVAAPRPPGTEAEMLEAVRLLSIRNKADPIDVRPELASSVREMIRVEESAREHIRRSPLLQEGETTRAVAPADDFEMARRLTRLLSPSRADDYTAWMRAGWCLHNIDDRLLPDWIDFSRMSSKFEAGVCEILWDHMARQSGGLGMGSLRMWARQDGEEEYEAIVRQCVSSRVHAAISGLHHDVAMVVKGMYGTRFACSSIRNNAWYQFKDHRWRACDNGFLLRCMLSTEIYHRFTDEAMRCNQQSRELVGGGGGGSSGMGGGGGGVGGSGMSGEVCAANSVLTEKYQRLNAVAVKLKTTSFKDCVMRECKELFYREGFESDLDGDPSILGFENGVYDLDTHEFRDGAPEDMVSYTTGYSYTPYDPHNENLKDILRFFAEIHVNRNVREYMLGLIGSYLNGRIREERFHVWTGSGANGKSLTIDLIERALGDYSCKLPVALLTQKRAASNAATSEIARLKGRRFAVLQEPGADETLNVGLMKELTGGDKIMARQLYREPIEFKSYARLSLICNNLPTVPSTDGGSWRRIRVIDFASKFKDDPDPNNPREFKVDKTISDRLDSWAPHMMAVLIEYYKRYTRRGNPEPPEVMSATRSYQESQDSVQLFINARIVRDPASTIPVAETHAMYKDFIREMSISGVNTRRADFIKEIERHAGVKVSGSGASPKFRGLAFVVEETDAGSSSAGDDDDDDDDGGDGDGGDGGDRDGDGGGDGDGGDRDGDGGSGSGVDVHVEQGHPSS